MKKIIPKDAHLIPKGAKKVFSGVIYDVYQWQQEMFDGSFETFEMAKRADTVSVIPIKGDKLVALRQTQPGWSASKYGFPGGRVDEEDDSPLEAIKRELKEETGLTFKTWKLVGVQQREEKIEWFHYKFIATELEGKGEPHIDVGEQIEILEVGFEKAKEMAEKDPRMGAGIIDKHGSLDELLGMPAFEGREVEV